MLLRPSTCFPLHLVGGVSSSKARPKIWPFATASSSPSAAKPASLFLPIDQKDGVLEPKKTDVGSLPMGTSSSSPFFTHADMVGVLGGVSAACTINFLEKLVECSSRDGKESLPFIVCSDSVPSRELSPRRGSPHVYSRAEKNSSFHLNHAQIVENLRHKRTFLEHSGARCIVMPCHVCHSWHHDVAESCSVPFLHVGESVASELKAADLRPVETGSNVRIGVLASDAALAAGVYQESLQNMGFEIVLPDKATIEHTIIPAVEALSRKDMKGARTLLRIALQVLLVKAVNRIVLACDDMQGLLPCDDPILKNCIDPMDALARSTIEWVKSTKNMHSST